MKSSTPSTQLSRLNAAAEKMSLSCWTGEPTSATKPAVTANGSGSDVSSVAVSERAPRPSPVPGSPSPVM